MENAEDVDLGKVSPQLMAVLESAARFQSLVPEAVLTGGTVANRITPGKIVLSRLGDIEAGVRQMIRTTPLETQRIELPSGRMLEVPTAEETLRIKAFLIVRRNQVRDYLDVAALADKYGIDAAARVLGDIDRFYADEDREGIPVSSQLVRQLGAPDPRTRIGSGRSRATRVWPLGGVSGPRSSKSASGLPRRW